MVLLRHFNLKVKKQDHIYLTFDDGPNPDSTPQILDILKENDIKSTFFITGENMEKYPHIIKGMIEDGHIVGDHSYSHIHPWKSNPFTYYSDLRKGNQLINKYLNNKASNLFRPPYGKLNILTLFYIWFYKKKIIFWNIDPKDYEAQTAREVTKRVINQLSSKSIILLHDDRKNSNGSNLNITINAIKMIIDEVGDSNLFLKLTI